jgi:hypothetical protein
MLLILVIIEIVRVNKLLSFRIWPVSILFSDIEAEDA